jgi:hypothetical protein
MESELKSILSLVVILLLAASSYGQTVCPHCGKIHAVQPVTSYQAGFQTSYQSVGHAQPVRSFANNVQALAQQKANRAASMLSKGHVGGSMGIATHEGVGFSSASPQQAIDAACYSGSPISAQGPGRPRLATAVARGSDGWYACLLCQ